MIVALYTNKIDTFIEEQFKTSKMIIYWLLLNSWGVVL